MCGPGVRWDSPAYYRISAHYKFMLWKMFDDLGYERVIILEDDMEAGSTPPLQPLRHLLLIGIHASTL